MASYPAHLRAIIMDSSEEDLRSVLANAMEREKDKRVLRQMTLVYNALNKSMRNGQAYVHHEQQPSPVNAIVRAQ